MTRSYGSGGGDFWLVKTDENGEEEWNNTFGGFGGEIAFSVRQTLDGGYVLVGWMESDDEGMGDSLLVKADEMGDEEWSMAFSGAAFDVGRSVQQTADGGYIFAGHTESYSAREYDYWLVKVDELGNGEWNKAFGGTDYEEAYFVQQTSDDGYIIAGKTKSFGEGGYDFWLVKTDEEGNKEWSKTLGDFREDVANSVQQTSDGGYIVVGWTESQGAGKKDCWVVKLK